METLPEAGRPAGDSGYAYQDLVVAHEITRMLRDANTTAVWPEAFAEVDDILVQRADGRDIYGQVKEFSPGAEWTATSLARQGVVGDFLTQHRTTPSATLSFYTFSSARSVREAAQRARNARANHPSDEDLAITEWLDRLRVDGRLFLSRLKQSLKIDDRQALSLLELVVVHDALGSREQLRSRLSVELASLVQEPDCAADSILRLVRQRSIERVRVTRADVRQHLSNDACGPFAAGWAPIPDSDAYAGELADRVTRLDIARLPDLELLLSEEGHTTTTLPSGVPHRAMILGRHGAGKSRLSAQLARVWLQQGRPGLHVALGGWVDELPLLLAAELARASGRSVRRGEEASVLDLPQAFVVFDGLDDILGSARDLASRAIAEYAAMHPDVQLVVTSRPGRLPDAIARWPTLAVQDLTDEQVQIVLGQDAWRLPEPLRELARNPLMLGLLHQAQTAAGTLPNTEASIIASYVQLLVERDATSSSVDPLLGMAIAGEYAFEWLSSGRLQVTEEEFRTLGQRVIATLRGLGYGNSVDVQGAEAWLIRVGVAVRLPGGTVSPSHRSVLDHLAGAALRRRQPADVVGIPYLREATAHYIALADVVDGTVLAVLDEAASKDIELLARCRRMASPNIAWTDKPQDFAFAYLRAVRRIQIGQLRNVPLVAPAMEVGVDKGLTWLQEDEIPGDRDRVRVTKQPQAMLLTSGDGSPGTMVSSFSFGAHTGRQVAVKVPHFVAFERIDEVLKRVLNNYLLPDEGPDITYERLSLFKHDLERTFNFINRGSVPGTLPQDLHLLTGRELLQRCTEIATHLVGRPVAGDQLPYVRLAYDPGRRSVIATRSEPTADDMRLSRGRHGRRGIHIGALQLLLSQADAFGLRDLPLHDLGLRPDSATDPILSLDGRFHMLHGDDLLLAIERAQRLILVAYRYLADNNLPGLAPALRNYTDGPIGLELVVDDKSTGGVIDVCAYIRSFEATGAMDDIRVTLGERPVGKRPFEWGFSVLHYFESVADEAYRDLSTDISRALDGAAALGARSL